MASSKDVSLGQSENQKKVFLITYEVETTTEMFAKELSEHIRSYDCEIVDKICNLKDNNFPVLVIVNGETHNINEKLKEIDKQLAEQQYKGFVVVVVVCIDDSQPKLVNCIYSKITATFKMIFNTGGTKTSGANFFERNKTVIKRIESVLTNGSKKDAFLICYNMGTADFAQKFPKWMADWNFQTVDQLKCVKNQTLPMLVIVNEEMRDGRNLREILIDIDNCLNDQLNTGPVIVIVMKIEDCSRTSFPYTEGSYKLIKNIVKMEFKEGHFETKLGRTTAINECARKHIRYFLKNWNREKVLIYDFENGNTSKCFIDALKGFLPEVHLKNFHAANINERKLLPIIAVVRHIAPRCEDYLDQLKQSLIKANVDDLGRVTVVYFCSSESDLGITDEIKHISGSGKYGFAKLVVMDFIGKKLINGGFHILSSSKSKMNANAKGETLMSIHSTNTKKMTEVTEKVSVSGKCRVDTESMKLEPADDDDNIETVTHLLKDLKTTMNLSLEEQRKTNQILSQIFAPQNKH